MNLNILFLCAVFPVLLMSTCQECPPREGSYVWVRGVILDSVYDEVTVLPSGISEPIPDFFEERTLCRQCLPLDISSESTTYILRGNARTDTLTFSYLTNVTYYGNTCGYRAMAEEMQITSTFTTDSLLSKDYFNEGIWHVYLEL